MAGARRSDRGLRKRKGSKRALMMESQRSAKVEREMRTWTCAVEGS